MLSQDQIDFYHINGYVMVEDAIPAQELALLQQVTADFIDQSRNCTQNNELYDLEEGHTAETPRLTRIKQPHAQHSAYWSALISDRMTCILKSLLGPDVRLHNSKLNTKAPGGGVAVEWHQDWAFYPHTNDNLLAISIMLNDVSMENGPLMVIPGSHKEGVLDHSANGVFAGAINPDDPAFDINRAIPLTGRAGNMTIHHVRTLHGSAPNLSDQARMLLFYECGAADAWSLGGNSSAYTGIGLDQYWQFMTDRLICGEQSLTPRLENVPVRMPLPPPPDSSSIFKVQKSSGVRSAFS
ncbi:MAG: phytanoyl-CoA hydroxylase [Granulosicoccus sp.]|jgi:phytanoyl-CoA hydroxylase